jgi:ABC-2 type transport system permease protein
MFNTRLLSLIRKEFIQILRDPRTLAITVAVPVVMLFLLGYAATNDVRNISMAVLDQDRSPDSRALLDAYRSADYFKLDHEVDTEEQMRELIDLGDCRAGIIIPPDFSEKLASGQSTSVALVVDGSDPTLATTARASAMLIGQNFATQIAAARLDQRGLSISMTPAVDVRTQVWYNPGLKSANYMIPGMIGMILMFLTTLLTCTSIVRERERGTIEQLIVTPLRKWELVVGKLAPYVFIAFFDMIEVLFVGTLVFDFPINGSLLLLLLLSALFLTSSLGIGLLISTIANTQQEAMLTTMLTLLPSIFLSGFFFPLAAMPPFLQALSYVIPLRYFLIISRGVITKGVGLESLWNEVLFLTIFAILVGIAAITRFKKRLD